MEQPTMVERAARAMEPGPFERRDAGWPMRNLNVYAAATMRSDLRRISKAMKNARAAIATMRVPTEEIIAAICEFELTSEGAAEIWQAAIDAALAPAAEVK